MPERTMLHNSLTPVNTPFKIRASTDPSGIDVIAFMGADQTSQGEIESVLASEAQAVEGAIALLYRYAPQALDSWVVDGLDRGEEVEIQGRKGYLVVVEEQAKPEFTEL